MRKVRKYIQSLVLLLLLFSCTREYPDGGEYGYLNVRLGEENSAELILKSSDYTPDLSEYSLSIFKQDGNTLVKKIDDLSTLQQSIQIPVGTYIVKASNTAPNAGWETPLYIGTEEVSINKDQTKDVNITCFLANTKVTVSFDESVSELFSSYKAVVSNAQGTPLEFGPDSPAGYFAVSGSLNWSVVLVNSDGITYQSAPQTVNDVRAKQHYHFNYKIVRQEGGNGAGAFILIVDDSYTEKNYSLTINDSNHNAPEIISDIDEIVELPQNANFGKSIVLMADAGIKQILFNHNSSSLTSILPKWNSLYSLNDGSLLPDGISLDFKDASMTEASLGLGGFVKALPMGEYTFYLTLIDQQNKYADKQFTIIIANSVEAEAVSVKAWANFAIFTAKWNTTSLPEGFTLQYKKADEPDWTDCPTPIYNNASRSAVVEVWGLTEQTDYKFRAISAKDTEGVMVLSFTTESKQTVPNLSFDDWYKDGSAWMPNKSGQRVWDSANPGSASMGAVPTTPEETIVAVAGEGKKAAKLKTAKVLTILAAGNIYTGQFSKVSGLGAELKWGYAFNSRPIALKGYLRYEPATIDMAKDPYTSLKGQSDQASVKVFLTDWTSQFTVNTSNGTFLQDDDLSIIAMGALYTGATDGEYIEFVIPIEYRNTDKIPSFITIGCAASRYGDYFTGGVGSTLYLDEFSLVYDPSELTEEQRELVNYR